MYATRHIICRLTLALLFGAAALSAQSRKAGSDSGHPFDAKRKTLASPTLSAPAVRMETQNIRQNVNAFFAKQRPAITPQMRAYEALLQRSENADIRWDEKNGVPIYISGVRIAALPKGINPAAPAAAEPIARQFLRENAALLRINDPDDEFAVMKTERDALGMTHIRYQQTYGGLEIWGSDVFVHLDAANRFDSFNGRYRPSPVLLDTRPQRHISEADAIAAAQKAYGEGGRAEIQKKVIWYDEDDVAHVTWQVLLERGLIDRWIYFVDAESGEVVKKYSLIRDQGHAQGSGTDLLNKQRSLNLYLSGSEYGMIDISKPMYNAAASNLPAKGIGVIYTLDARNADSTLFFITSTDPNNWPDRASVSASANSSLVYDYFKQVHNRDAIDGKGSSINVVINFMQNFNNAFWNGRLMVFGNGDGQNFSDLSASLDVTAHEMTHGVTENTANLIYENQPGALNESFSDVFGVMFDFWVNGDNGNWLLGEDIVTPGIPGDAMRNMADPGAANVAFQGQQPSHMSEYRNLPNTKEGNNGGVHVNSGIPNKAFYLFVQSVGRDDAQKVYYRALSNYLTRNSQFVDCRIAVIKAAQDLYGENSSQATAAAQAFDGVGITGGSATPPPAPLPQVNGQEFLAVTDASSGQLVRSTLDASQFLALSSAALLSRPSPTDDGKFFYYVDNKNYIHVAATDGSRDDVISQTGEWSTVSIAPNGRFLAAISKYSEPYIYIFDLVDGSGSKTLQLYTPTYTEGTTSGSIEYPDRIDWTKNSQLIMYDALNSYRNITGKTEYWDINLVRLADGLVARMFPPQPPGVSIGNAVFASNTDSKIVFDHVDENGQVSVLSFDLNSGTQGFVTNNFGSLGVPTFSGDDKRIYYQYVDNNGSGIWFVDLDTDGLNSKKNDTQIISGGINPVSFVIGDRPTGVDHAPDGVPQEFTLLQNYPNPFNPETVIAYELPWNGAVSIRIIDYLGRVIYSETRSGQQAGRNRFVWQGVDKNGVEAPSGIYFYEISSTSPDGARHTLSNKMTLLR